MAKAAKAKNTLAEARRLAEEHGSIGVIIDFPKNAAPYWAAHATWLCSPDISVFAPKRSTALIGLCAALRSLRAGKGKSR